MNKPRKLVQSPLFWLALLTPIVSGVALYIASVASNESKVICFSSECINNFFNLYKFPLSLIGLTVPLTAIVAALHRSEEAHQQIEETIRQNTFNNYIKHREDFNDLLVKIETKCLCQFTDPLTLYRSIFPHNNYSEFSFYAHAKKPIEDRTRNSFLELLRMEIFDIKSVLYNPDCETKDLIDIIIGIQEITSRLHLKPSSATSEKFPDSKYVWPDRFATNSVENLKTIQRELYSFSFYKSEIRENREALAARLRLPEAYAIQLRNSTDADELASEIEKDI